MASLSLSLHATASQQHRNNVITSNIFRLKFTKLSSFVFVFLGFFCLFIVRMRSIRTERNGDDKNSRNLRGCPWQTEYRTQWKIPNWNDLVGQHAQNVHTCIPFQLTVFAGDMNRCIRKILNGMKSERGRTHEPFELNRHNGHHIGWSVGPWVHTGRAHVDHGIACGVCPLSALFFWGLFAHTHTYCRALLLLEPPRGLREPAKYCRARAHLFILNSTARSW